MAADFKKVETYLRKRFNVPALGVRPMPKKKDTAEVYIGDEFIGMLYVDEEDGETAYQFQMSILELDLE